MVALGVVALFHTVAIAGFALSLALIIDAVISGVPLARVGELLGWFLAAVALRALTLVILDALAQRGGSRVKSELRRSALASLRKRGPGYMASTSSSDITTLLAQGIDALDVYFGRYLPQLALTAIQLPVLLVVLWFADIPTGIAIIVALPVIPLFMVLIGWATQAVQKRQWEGMQVLARGFIDLVEGLPTLKIFGRHWRQVEKIRDLTAQLRKRTMAVLRVSFLSSFVLELAASLSVAIVAVSVGIRLIDGSLPLWLGLFVLILVPEIYIPLRAVGTQFHNAQEGLAAAEDVIGIIETPTSEPFDPPATSAGDSQSTPGLIFRDFQALRGGQPVSHPLSAEMVPGQVTVVHGSSGSGKSTLIDALLGFTDWTGQVVWAGKPMGPDGLRDLIAWSPQNPSLLAGTIAENVALGDDSPDRDRVVEVLERVGLAGTDPATRLGVHGSGLSGGQAQRVALARALYRQARLSCPIVVCDEVTSALDSDTEDVVWSAIEDLASRGCLCLVVSHRLRVNARADHTVKVTGLEPTRVGP